jgi:hypothetical protein
VEDTSGTATDPFSDLTNLRIPQEQLQTYFAAKTHPPNPLVLPVRSKSIGGPILVGWLVAAAKQGKDALLVGLMVWCARNWPKLGRASESVLLSDELFNAWGIARPARALSRLESSGLIKIVGRHERHVEVDLLVPGSFCGQFILGPVDVSWELCGNLGDDD